MTEQNQLLAEKYRVESEPFHFLVDAVTDCAIYMLDLDGRVVTWNSGAQRLKGYSADEIIGEDFSRFFIDEERRAGRHLQALETAKQQGGTKPRAGACAATAAAFGSTPSSIRSATKPAS